MKLTTRQLKQIIKEELEEGLSFLQKPNVRADLSTQIEKDLSSGAKFLLNPSLRLINLKYFNDSAGELLRRLSLSVDERGNQINFMVYLEFDHKVQKELIAYTSYEAIDSWHYGECSPSPFEKSTTYSLARTARSDFARAEKLGIGKLMSLLATCYINKQGGAVTSDRSVSDKAGKMVKQLRSFERLGFVTISKDFDYTGFCYHLLRRGWKNMRGQMNSENPQDKEWLDLTKEILEMLEPVTQTRKDDCMPPTNIQINNTRVMEAILSIRNDKDLRKLKSFHTFLRDKGTPANIRKFFNEDKRVSNFTFQFSDKVIDGAMEIINKINETDNLSPDDLEQKTKEGERMFKGIYKKEVGKLGRSITTEQLKKIIREELNEAFASTKKEDR